MSRIFRPAAIILFLATLLAIATAQTSCCRKEGCGPTGCEGASPNHAICSWCCGGETGGQGGPEANSCLSCGFQNVDDCLQKTLCRGTWGQMNPNWRSCGSIEDCARNYCTVLCANAP